jgi:hypothetical protein
MIISSGTEKYGGLGYQEREGLVDITLQKRNYFSGIMAI